MISPAPLRGFAPGGPRLWAGKAGSSACAGRASPRWLVVLLLGALLGSGCSTTTGPGYYWQSVTGHLALMHAARPVQDWLDDPATPAPLRERLALTRRMRDFAVHTLALPANASYQRYARLDRRAAVYNVVAAPALSLKPHQWCFPVVGCVGYRGYFDEAQAQAYARSLPASLDVAVHPVPAYSTLGWTNWVGGDPLLSTFVGYPEGELARLLFHELAHQVLYLADDTAFNESFATAVERLGGALWLAQASEAARTEYARFDARRREFQALTRATRQQLARCFDDETLSEADKRRGKAAVMADFHTKYQAFKERWDGYPGYDAWVARANNASFAAQSAYDDWVPAFTALFEREGRDFQRFYDAVRALARRDAEDRQAALRTLSPDTPAPLGPDEHRHRTSAASMADIHIRRAHTLGLNGARQLAMRWAEQAESEFDMRCTVAEVQGCDEVQFTRSGVSGTLRVGADHFELEARLGFLLAAFKDRIEGEIVKNLDQLLAQPSPGSPPKA